MSNALEWLKVLGGIAGLVALVWRFFDEFGAYLRIVVAVDAASTGPVSVLTTIDNKGNRAKDVSYAFLLLGPEEESPVKSANVIRRSIGLDGEIQFTNELENLVVTSTIYADGRALIPLPFYYLENVSIGDETLTYRAPIQVRSLTDRTYYSVRLYVFGPRRLHRSTQDCFLNVHEPAVV
jgi:hypothetical protein